MPQLSPQTLPVPETTSHETTSRERPPAPTRLAVKAEQLALNGPRGPVYGPLTLNVPEGWLVAAIGDQGSGRTSLLLTLVGRMRATSGHLSVLGHQLPHHRRDVQSHAALANIANVDDLDGGLTVAELVRERAGLSVPIWRRPLGLHDARMRHLMSVSFGDQVPDPSTRVWDLSPLQALQLRVLLSAIGNPRLIVVDNVDDVRDPDQQREAWRTLQRVCGLGITIIASAASDHAVPPGVQVVHLATHTTPWDSAAPARPMDAAISEETHA